MTGRQKIPRETAADRARLYMERLSDTERSELLRLAQNQRHDGESTPEQIVGNAVLAFAVLYMPQPVAPENTPERVVQWVSMLLKGSPAMYDKMVGKAHRCIEPNVTSYLS